MNSEDLIQIGAYKKGTSREIDEAIQYYPDIISFLKQGVYEQISLPASVDELIKLSEKGG